MKTTDGQSGTPAAASGTAPGGAAEARPPSDPEVVDLIAAAARPGIDPCDVACEAMPAHLLGDLAPSEDRWLLDHTSGCGYCANELDRFERTAGVLDSLHRLPDSLPFGAAPPAPPAPPLPRRPRAGYARLPSPVGPLFVAASESGLCEIDFVGQGAEESEGTFRRRLADRGFEPRPVPDDCDGSEIWATLVDAAAQIQQYFSGRRDRFDLPLDFAGVSPFTRAVLDATAEVPFGRLDTYQGIARAIGKPKATRAVGNALGRNPIPVVVPCHRIVRSGGAIGGYTGGLGIKQTLLRIEGVALA